MVNLRFVGDQKTGQRTYRTSNIFCSLDQPGTCNIMVSAAQAAQMMKDHPTWFKQGDNSNLEKAVKDEEEVAKTLSKPIPLVDALALDRTKKILYMAGTLKIPVDKKLKVSELDILIRSHYIDEEME